jgi:RNA polymerase sigma factor (sigma-70 family)
VAERRGVASEELEALYRERFHAFLRVAEGVCGEVELARDAVQEAFASALRGRRSYRGDGSVEAWVWRMVVNAARKAAGRRLDRVATALPEEPATNGSGFGEVRSFVSVLPEQQRLAVFLRYYADLDYAAIAEVLGVTTGTVGATLTAARGSLKRALEGVAG